MKSFCGWRDAEMNWECLYGTHSIIDSFLLSKKVSTVEVPPQQKYFVVLAQIVVLIQPRNRKTLSMIGSVALLHNSIAFPSYLDDW